MAGNITDFAICIDKNLAIATLPTGTVRAAASGQSQKIVIGKATTMATPFCNGIYDGTQYLPFTALPANPNFSGQFVIIGRVSSDPTYWGCTDTAALIAQCLVLNGGNDAAPSFSDFGQEIANCKTWLDANGYALSNSSASFLAGYFP